MAFSPREPTGIGRFGPVHVTARGGEGPRQTWALLALDSYFRRNDEQTVGFRFAVGLSVLHNFTQQSDGVQVVAPDDLQIIGWHFRASVGQKSAGRSGTRPNPQGAAIPNWGRYLCAARIGA